jgi:ComF family protein
MMPDNRLNTVQSKLSALHPLPFFSQDCLLCGGGCHAGLLCRACRLELPAPGTGRCPRCASASGSGGECGSCLGDPPAFAATHAAFDYAFPVDRLLQRFKFQGDLALAGLFAEALGKRVAAAPRPDLVVAAPLAPRRLRTRGFNQAVEIGRRTASRLALRFEAAACVKLVDTAAQTDLEGAERRRNLRGAFAVRSDVRGLHVAVVDDVMTTGTTLDEIARALLAAGAGRVDAWAVARTPAPWESGP